MLSVTSPTRDDIFQIANFRQIFCSKLLSEICDLKFEIKLVPTVRFELTNHGF